ncbi:hypothetical protein HGRIS_014394 [Hohenbuehelia grisea]|uniref:NEDD8-activating enzyme E1 regulatory subunit n=1 Tax=Hohenbuehelia grisea TaxID=104357 RepID=A0ABR3JVG0_9AGAR
MPDSQTIESATTALATRTPQPDTKTRRYDRQLRLWAASGQAALESARVLVISGSATSTSILKNLVLPGIGHFTILDHERVSPADAGNNFFLEGQSSVGKFRAEEAVRLLRELNDGVEGKADTRIIEQVLDNDPAFITSFSLVIAHNLNENTVARIAKLLWEDETYPSFVVVRSSGFLAEFSIQFHEHTVIESHSETAPTLRIDKPFPALLEYANSLDFTNMDPTEHSHIPYVVILVRVLEDWKKSHNGAAPKTYEEKKEFKKTITAMKVKVDEENFDEAEAQAYRCWTESSVPSEIAALFQDPKAFSAASSSSSTSPFFALLAALRAFTVQHDPPQVLPLSATLPDMKSNTVNYVHLQTLYKKRAEEEKAQFKKYLALSGGAGIDDALIDSFVKNAHALKLLRGRQWTSVHSSAETLGNSMAMNSKHVSTHLALASLSSLQAKQADTKVTTEALTAEAATLLPSGLELPEEWDEAAGEIARSPNADLPNMAALLGGLVAQEVIKMITKQYVPINGYCVVDLIEMWTGVVG